MEARTHTFASRSSGRTMWSEGRGFQRLFGDLVAKAEREEAASVVRGVLHGQCVAGDAVVAVVRIARHRKRNLRMPRKTREPRSFGLQI